MRIGFIGLGTMGAGMAANAQAGGYELVVSDLRQDAAREHIQNGAVWASSPREVAEQVEVVFTSLPTPADVENVAAGDDGLRAGLRPGSAWFDLSTNSVDVVRRLHAELAQREIHFLDAPVSGAPKGRLAIWVGGERIVFERFADVLDSIGNTVRYIGDIGAGTVAKLTHNMATIAIDAVVVEVLSMGVKAGVEPAALWEAIRTGAVGRSRTFDPVGRQFLKGRFDPPLFELRLANKDVQLALELARDSDVPTPMCGLAGDQMTEAMNRGWGARGYSSYLLVQQERAAVPPFELSDEDVERILSQD